MIKGMLRRLSTRRRLLIALAAALGGLLSLASGFGHGAELALRDVRDTLRSRPASGEVHIVEIDARSIAAIARWPWPRHFHAEAVERLRMAGVRSIAFDVDFSSASVAEEDARFAAALRRAGGNVILPTFRQNAAYGRVEAIESAPIPSLAESSFLAAANVMPDSDGYLRRMPYGVETMGLARPSLAAMLAESAGESGRLFAIDYSVDPGSIPRHSMVDLIQGRVDPALLAGKRVIVGATAVELGDRYLVPRHGILPGVVIQALAAETLMRSPPAEPAGPAPALALALATVWLAGGRRSAHARAAGLVAIAPPLLALAFYGDIWFGVEVAVAPALAALGCAALAAAAVAAAERGRARSRSDASTGLPNLAALEADAAGQAEVRIVVARLDQFAGLAAGLGPELTASLVLQVAQRLRCSGSSAAVHRVDEASLAWLAPPMTDLEALAARTSALLRAPFDCGRVVTVSAHLGAADGAGAAAGPLVANAALAAERAAAEGARSRLFTENHAEEASRGLTLLADFDRALAEGRIWNAYQPQFDLAGDWISGVEALVRWTHPTLGALAPDGFIPLLENKGRIRDLTLHVMDQGLADAAAWSGEGRPLTLAVNISALLLSDAGFVRAVRDLLDRSGFRPDRLTLEITESAAMSDPAAAMAALESWRSLGVGISIDDYGTGQSSLSYLQKLPATEIKIDKSFVATIAEDPRNAVMVRSTIAMAHELGLAVVAEGVEDEACLERLRAMGCDIAQGYLIGRPGPPESLAALLEAPLLLAGSRRSAAG